MNRTETKSWVDYHGELVESFGAWFAGMTDATKRLNLDVWVKAFRQTDLSDAREATDRMVSGEVRRPFSVEDQVAAIVGEAARLRRARKTRVPVDGQATYACPYCLDTGLVECFKRDCLHTMMAICCCDAGNARKTARINGRQPFLDYQQYDPKRCYRVGDTSDAWNNVRAAIEWEKQAGTFRTAEQLQAEREASSEMTAHA